MAQEMTTQSILPNNQSNNQETPSQGGMQVRLPIEGMTCASCVRRVERAVAKLPGVQAAAVNLATEKATVRYTPGAVSREDFKQAVERAGYALGPEEQARAEKVQRATDQT